jgi:hypothetical protein
MARPYRFSFSYSAWSLWKKCPQAFKFEKVDKLPVPENPAFVKGRAVHEAMERYITSAPGDRIVRPEAAAKFTALVDGLRAVPPERKIVEQQMAFDREQRPCDWFGPNAYARYVWDVAVLDDPARPQRIDMADWKTGKPYGSYDEQMQLFAVPAFLRYPTLWEFSTNLVYLEHGEVQQQTYNRAQFEGGLNDLWRGNAAMMEADQAYAPKPSKQACRFCPFHQDKGGPCTVGAR